MRRMVTWRWGRRGKPHASTQSTFCLDNPNDHHPLSDQTLLITWSSSSLVTASQQVLTKLWFTASAVVSHALVCWLLPAVSSSQLVHPLSGSGRGKYSPTGFATFSESRGLHNTRSHDPGILSLPAQTSQHHRCRCANTQQGEKGIKYVIEKYRCTNT